MFALIFLLTIIAGGCIRSDPISAPTVTPTNSARLPASNGFVNGYLPPTMPDAKPAPLDVEVAEWAGVIAETFNFIEYSYEEFSLPAHYRWFDVQIFYDINTAVSGWGNVVTTENMSFYMDSQGARSMVMAFVSSPDGQQPAYVTLVYSYNIFDDTQEELLTGEYNLDFQVDIDGFSFTNYTNQFPEGNLTAEETHALFGNQVCSRFDNGRCIILPAALLWTNQMNRLAEVGHCTGMTVISGLLKSQTSDFLTPIDGQKAADIPREAPILRKIAANWALQMTYEVTGSIVEGTPRHILGELLQMRGLVDIGIFSDQGGHSLLGHGVLDQDNGIFLVQVYDGNFPGEKKFLQIDTNANTWAYSMDGLDPWNDPQAWSGDAGSFTLMFIPIAVYAQDFACPFCPLNGNTGISGGPLAIPMPARKPPSDHTLVTLSGGSSTGNLRAVSSFGERVGIANNEFFNELIGARIIRVRGLSNAVALLMPPGIDIQLDFSGSSPFTDNNLLLTTPGFSININGLSNQAHNLSFSPTSQQFTYTPVNNESPQFVITINQGNDSFMFILDGASLSAGSSISLGIDPENGNFNIVAPNNENAGLALTIVHTGPSGDAIFSTQVLTLNAGSQTSLDFDGWSETGVLTVMIDQNLDGLTDDTGILEGQDLTDLLLRDSTFGELLAYLDLLSPYMNQADVINLLSNLSEAGLNSELFIELITKYHLNFNLSIEDLALILKAWNLSAFDLARIATITGYSYADLDVLLNPPPPVVVFVPLLEKPVLWTPTPNPDEEGDEEDETDQTQTTDTGALGTITGALANNGLVASNTSVFLEYCNAAGNCSQVSSVITDIYGVYTFSAAPLNASETYQVKRVNDADISLLGAVFLPRINSLASNQTIAGGNFDIANVDLGKPVGGCGELTIGVNFSWDPNIYRGSVPPEQYQLIIYDDTDNDPYWNSGSLGLGITVYQMNTSNFPTELSVDVPYDWYVNIDDGSGTYNRSFESRALTFNSTGCP